MFEERPTTEPGLPLTAGVSSISIEGLQSRTQISEEYCYGQVVTVGFGLSNRTVTDDS